MTRRDVTFAAIMSAVALAVYMGVKVWLGGHWDWVTFVIWVLAALLFGFGIIYAKSFLIRMVDEMTEDGVTPSEGERRTGVGAGSERNSHAESIADAAVESSAEHAHHLGHQHHRRQESSNS